MHANQDIAQNTTKVVRKKKEQKKEKLDENRKKKCKEVEKKWNIKDGQKEGIAQIGK